MATARKRPRVPGLGLLAAERPSRSSGPRLLRLCSEHTKDTCMLRAGSVQPLLDSEVACPLGALLSASDETIPEGEEVAGRPLRARISEGSRGPACAAEQRASNFQRMLDKTLSERSQRSRRGVGGPAGRSHVYSLLPSPPSSLEFACSGPGCSTSGLGTDASPYQEWSHFFMTLMGDVFLGVATWG